MPITKKGNLQGEVGIARVAQGRQVNVVLAPARQRHVPALPVLARGACEYRPVEILHDAEPEQAAEAYGDISVSAETHVHAEISSQHDQPRRGGGCVIEISHQRGGRRERFKIPAACGAANDGFFYRFSPELARHFRAGHAS